MISHMLVDFLPDEGLRDLLEEIVHIWEHYQPTPLLSSFEPSQSRRVFKAKLSRRYERPTFSIVEE